MAKLAVIEGDSKSFDSIMFQQPATILFSLPDWVAQYACSMGTITNREDRVCFVIEASRQNIIKKTGGPFAAAIFEGQSGLLISLGVNLVPTRQSSILHAEMVAIALAQMKLGVYDLEQRGSYEMISSAEPCAMCLGAIPWSGVRRVITAATDADVRSVGFDEGTKRIPWQQSLLEKGIEVVTEVNRDEARSVLNTYLQTGGEIYNA